MSTSKIFIILILALLAACNETSKSKLLLIQKTNATDPFKNTIVKSQFFTILPSKDNIIESENGNVVFIPEGTFIDRLGNKVKDSLKIEFAEVSTIEDYIMSNITIGDSDHIYAFCNAFFINATMQGEQLDINKEKSIYIEIASTKNIELIKGYRDDKGNMSWNESISPVKYLIPVDFDFLNFYPEGFESEIDKGLPFKGHKILTKTLSDSLYYSFAPELDSKGHYNWNHTIMIDLIPLFFNHHPEIKSDTTILINFCGINPASIKAIKDKKFQHTFLATREFELRLKAIFKTCNNNYLELYVNNLNKNLWEVDSLVAEKLGKSDSMYQTFRDFTAERLTNVKLSDNKAKLLSDYYLEQKTKIEDKLQKIKNEIIQEKEKQEKIIEQKSDEYRNLLEKRFTYRMKKFGFEMTSLGWYNAVNEISIDQVDTFQLNVSVVNGRDFDRVYTYVINPNIRSIFSLLSLDNIKFNHVFAEDPYLLLWKNQKFNVIGVGYKNEQLSYNLNESTQQPVINIELMLNQSDIKDFKQAIKKYNTLYNKENKILVDLEYQAFFYKEQRRKAKELEEIIFITKLRKIVFPCCDFETKEHLSK